MSNLKKIIIFLKDRIFSGFVLCKFIIFIRDTLSCLRCDSYTHRIDKITSPALLCMSNQSRCFPFYHFHRNNCLPSFLRVYSMLFTIAFPLCGRVSFFIIKSENNGRFEKYAKALTKQTVLLHNSFPPSRIGYLIEVCAQTN